MAGAGHAGGRRSRARPSRLAVYLGVRFVAAVVFVVAATVVPRGLPAGLLILGAGLAAMLTCVGTNAGGPGERAGARAQDRWFDAHTAPQGDWPPYEPASDVAGAPASGDGLPAAGNASPRPDLA